VIDVNKIKKDFPILDRKIDGYSLVYLDNAATSQKPKQVVEAVTRYYFMHNSNVHRGVHLLSEEATQLYEDARRKVAGFIGVDNASEVIFTKGTTESINLVAQSWAKVNLKEGDVILSTDAEHHSNFLPWQRLAKEKGLNLDILKVDSYGCFPMSEFEKKLNNNVKLVAVAHSSNVLGTIFPIKEICRLAKEHSAKVLVDGAQAVPHLGVNVKSLGCDFYAFSGHKMLGPMGVGVLWVKKEILEDMEPYQLGGGMVEDVDLKEASWAGYPERFEAGTPDVAGAVGLASAVEYLESIGMDNIRKHELELLDYAFKRLGKIRGLKMYGPGKPEDKTGLISFTIEEIHPHDLAAVLSSYGIAVRSGQHCAIPLHKKLGVPSTIRASFYMYNDKADIDRLVEGINEAKEVLT